MNAWFDTLGGERILVTGANGFIGNALLKWFSANMTNPQVHWVKANILDSSSRIDLIKDVRPTQLISLAWEVKPGKFWDSASNHIWVSATIDLYELFLKFGGGYALFAGTCGEYAYRNHKIREHEVFAMSELSVYGNCKKQLSECVFQISASSGSRVGWARLFFPYGPTEPNEKLFSALAQVFSGKRQPFPVCFDSVRDFTFVSDIASALGLMSVRQTDGLYNVCTGVPTRIADVLAEFYRLHQFPDIIFPQKSGAEVQSMQVGCNEKLRGVIDWSPSYSISDGLSQYHKSNVD